MSQFLAQDEYQGKGRDIRAFLYLLRFARPYRQNLLGALTLIVSSSAFAVASARALGLLIEEGLGPENRATSFQWGGTILALEALAIASVWQGRRLLARSASFVIFDIRKALFRHIHELPLTYYDRQPQGRTITRMTHDVEGLEDFFAGSLGRLAVATITFAVAVLAMLATSFYLGLIMLALMIPAICLVFLTRGKIQQVNRNMSRLSSACNAKLAEYLGGLFVIRSFGLEDWSKANYDAVVRQHRQSQLEANTFYAWSRPLTNLFCLLPVIGLVSVGGQFVLEGTLSVGIFVAFVRYCERFSVPLSTLTREIHVIQQAFTSAERVSAFFQAEREEQTLGKSANRSADGLRGDLEFHNVTMAYEPGRPVLNSVSFSICHGEKIGLAGATGSGKSTTVSLLARLYEFQKGEIFLSGAPLRSYSRSSLRSQLGFVSQEVILFYGTIRDNLALGYPWSEEQIQNACAQTGLDQLLQQSRRSLDYQVLAKGLNLSAGEQQLMALTRILLKNPTILILDEATANVDPYHEKLIHQAVDKVMKGRTCLLIAHRLATLASCDRVFVFHQGYLVEQGPQSQLLASQGHFYRLTESMHAQV